MTDPWVLAYSGVDPKQEGLREALCALGNGLFVTRGAAEEASADDVHYPGTYVAGGYNQLTSEVAGRAVVNEDLVNFPNWLCLTFRPAGGEWLDLARLEVIDYRQELRLREGILWRWFRTRDDTGRVTAVESRRLVHMGNAHLAAIDYRVTPENWSGPIEFRSVLDGGVTNSGVARYRELANRHLEVVRSGLIAPDSAYLLVRTIQSRFEVGLAARTRLFCGTATVPVTVERRRMADDGAVGEVLLVEAAQGETLRVEKVVALFTMRDRGITECELDARLSVGRAASFEQLLTTHARAWSVLWRRYDIELEAEESNDVSSERQQLILRLHIFHLLQTVSPHSVGLDIGAPARGLHGEAYRGHVFWDELFILPFFTLRQPAMTRSLLMYRYHRLRAARTLAREAGFAGAMFPWQSSSDGREATQHLHLNPRSGSWDPDHSHLQRHVNAAIAYNIWSYYRVTGDRWFLDEYGAELLLEIARFWASAATKSETTSRWVIHGVVGPDEYHERYPDSEAGGLRNNAYTNAMAVWCLLRTFDALDAVGSERRRELLELLDIPAAELERWREITEKMTIPFRRDGVIEQFEGYGDLQELNWAAYREKYGNIERLDRILRAEGDTPDRYQVSKQADVNMLFYLLEPAELRELFGRLGYPFDDGTIERNIEYYRPRTSDGSTLSKVVFASVVHHLDPDEGCRLFFAALRSDVDDVQGGTTPEGIHLGAMAGTIGIVLRRYAGVALRTGDVELAPELPRHLRRVRFRVHHRDNWLDVDLTQERVRVALDESSTGPVTVVMYGTKRRLDPGGVLELGPHGAHLPLPPN